MKNYKARVLHLVMFTFVAIMMVAVLNYANRSRNASKIFSLNEGWTIEYNDEVYENVDLYNFRFPVTDKGDWIVLTNTLPENLPDDVTMRIHMIFTVTKIYVGDDLIFDYGLEDYEEGNLLGYGTRFVSLKDESAGKIVKITMFVTEDNAFSTITPPYVYYEHEAFEVFYGNLLLPLAVAITLSVVGICITIVTFCLYFKSYSMEKLFCIGVFSICIGCWSICNYNLDYLFTSSLRVKTYLEYLSLYLVLFPLLLYFREDVEARGKRWESFTYYLLLAIEIQLFVISTVCQFCNIVHFPVFVRVFQIFMGLVGVFLAILIVQDMRDERTHKILVIGFAVMLAFAVRDLIAFNFTKYSQSAGTESEYKSYVAAGALLFVVAMLVDFINEMRKQMYRNAETQLLEKIAYVDVLTGLYTRRKCEDVFEKIDGRGYEFAMVQFDLNNLKNTNDLYGHEAGDALILRFANILRSVFNEGETLGRMGGDEFIVMVTDAYDYNMKAKLEALEASIERDNEANKESGVKVSTSYGYCLSSEFNEATARDVYKEADRRMYKHKEEYYKAKGLGKRKYDQS